VTGDARFNRSKVNVIAGFERRCIGLASVHTGSVRTIEIPNVESAP
jgi:hypothetical protein